MASDRGRRAGAIDAARGQYQADAIASRGFSWLDFLREAGLVMTLVADRTDRATYATLQRPDASPRRWSSPRTERSVVEKLGAALPRATVRFFPGVGHMALINEAIAAHLQR